MVERVSKISDNDGGDEPRPKTDGVKKLSAAALTRCGTFIPAPNPGERQVF